MAVRPQFPRRNDGRTEGALVRLSALFRLAGGSERHLLLLPRRFARSAPSPAGVPGIAGRGEREVMARSFRSLRRRAGAHVPPYGAAARRGRGGGGTARGSGGYRRQRMRALLSGLQLPALGRQDGGR